MSCAVCYAYVHPYLDRCPACGTPAESRLTEALTAWAERDENASAVALPGEIWPRDPWQAYTAKQVAVGEGFIRAAKDKPNKALSAFTYRCLDGPPSLLPPCDVDIRATEGALTLVDRCGRPLLVIPFALLLSASASPSEAAVGWVGVAVGNFLTFTQPTVRTGNWLLTYSDGAGALEQVAIGARSGLLAGKPNDMFFLMMNLHVEALAAASLAAAEAEVGPIAYAIALGLGGALMAVETPPTPSVLPPHDALTALEDLRKDGLVTEAEYAAKRAEILERL
jgi:hypothetical protein